MGITAGIGIGVGVPGAAGGSRLGPWASRAVVPGGQRRSGLAARPLPRRPVLLGRGPRGIAPPAVALPVAASRGRPVPFRPIRRPGHGRLPLPHPPGGDHPAPVTPSVFRPRATSHEPTNGTLQDSLSPNSHPGGRRPRRRLSDGRPGPAAIAFRGVCGGWQSVGATFDRICADLSSTRSKMPGSPQCDVGYSTIEESSASTRMPRLTVSPLPLAGREADEGTDIRSVLRGPRRSAPGPNRLGSTARSPHSEFRHPRQRTATESHVTTDSADLARPNACPC